MTYIYTGIELGTLSEDIRKCRPVCRAGMRFPDQIHILATPVLKIMAGAAFIVQNVISTLTFHVLLEIRLSNIRSTSTVFLIFVEIESAFDVKPVLRAVVMTCAVACGATSICIVIASHSYRLI